MDDIHRRGWTVSKIHVKDQQYVAEGKNSHGEKLVATGRTDATAVANLLVKVMRREHMRSSALKEKVGAWDHYPIEQQFAVIAQAYAGAPVYEPKAAPAWMDLAQDCGRRAAIIRTQVAVEYTDDPVPYDDANELREDVTKKRHAWVSRAYAQHPVWSQQQMLDYRLVVDVLGHVVGGGDWGWHGTCLAFAALAPLLGETPQKALFTELLGQSAFGAFYRQWGPQKICFLDELIEKEQEKQNKPGHSGVHPSQSLVPTALPGIFSKTAMADRTGDPMIDRLIEAYMHQALPGSMGQKFPNAVIPALQDPTVSYGTCDAVADDFTTFCDEHGVNASGTLGNEFEWDPSESEFTNPAQFGYSLRPNDLDTHAVTYVEGSDGSIYLVDWTASQYGEKEFPMVQRLNDQDWQRKWANAPSIDPNADWESGVSPLPDAAYLWQRQNGVDPLDIHSFTDQLQQIEPGLSRMHPSMAKQSVVNALRSSLLGTRNNAMGHAIHYQDVMPIPADVDDPIAYWDALERQREHWNQNQGYAAGSHKQYWPEEQQFKQWVKATNPQLDDGEVQRLAKRELLHMLIEEEERVLAQDQGEQLPAEVVEHEVYEALKRRLKALTKPNVDQKVDFGEDHLYHEATHHADMYPPYLHSRVRPLAQVSRHADTLAQAARDDLLMHRGRGHHFRAQALNLGIPGLGPRQASHAWLHLAPQTSQLGIVNPEAADILGHDYAAETTNRDYFKHERELAAGRDAAGYGHTPLGAFSAGLWDLYAGGPGWHPDRTPFKAYGPAPHHGIDWQAQTPAMTGWTSPYWWESTKQAREQAAQDFDRNVATQYGRDQIPFQRTAGAGDRSPWVTHPMTGERLTGPPGTSLMAHLKDSFGHPDCQSVWAQDYEVGKGEPSRIAKVAAIPPMSELEPHRWDSECYEVAQGLANKYPQLAYDAGFYVHPRRGPGDHGWNIAPDGTIVDMTATQHQYMGPEDGPNDELESFPAPQHPEIIPPNDPHYDRYVSWQRHPERAQELAHQLGYHEGHDDNVGVCPLCTQGPAGTVAKVAMAERSGFPELDKAIEEFMQANPEIEELRDPRSAWGRCEETAQQCAEFLQARGFNAYAPSDELGAFEGYQDAQDSAAIGAGDFSYPEHAVVEVYGLYGPNNVNNVFIDFTASQYGFTEFPKVHGGPSDSPLG